MGKTGSTTRKRKPLTAADLVERYKADLWEWVVGREQDPDAQRAFRVALVAIRALLQRAQADVALVARLHEVLTDHARGLDAGKTDAARADLDLAVALQAAIAAEGRPEGLETARRIALVGLRRLSDIKHEPTADELQALAARSKTRKISALVAMLILKARGIGDEDRRRLQSETDRVGKSLARTRRTKS